MILKFFKEIEFIRILLNQNLYLNPNDKRILVNDF